MEGLHQLKAVAGQIERVINRIVLAVKLQGRQPGLLAKRAVE